MPPSVKQQVVDYIRLVDATIQKAATDLARREEADRQLSRRIPGVVDALARHGHIRPSEKAAVARELADPMVALDLLANLAPPRAAEPEAASLGRPYAEAKTASARPAGVTAIDGRAEVAPPSFRRFEERLGVRA